MTDDQSPAALARSIDEARQRFVSFVQHRTDGEWRSCPLDGDPRPVGVIADHVAHAYEYLAGWIASLASGEQVEVSSELVDELNAEHAGDAEGVTPVHVTGHLRSAGDELIALVADLQPGQLELAESRVRRLATIAARHADDHRADLEHALAGAV